MGTAVEGFDVDTVTDGEAVAVVLDGGDEVPVWDEHPPTAKPAASTAALSAVTGLSLIRLSCPTDRTFAEISLDFVAMATCPGSRGSGTEHDKASRPA
ncbi:MAG: hypothetical protein WCG47_23365 [Dermatophilaceae bacterium]